MYTTLTVCAQKQFQSLYDIMLLSVNILNGRISYLSFSPIIHFAIISILFIIIMTLRMLATVRNNAHAQSSVSRRSAAAASVHPTELSHCWVVKNQPKSLSVYLVSQDLQETNSCLAAKVHQLILHHQFDPRCLTVIRPR